MTLCAKSDREHNQYIVNTCMMVSLPSMTTRSSTRQITNVFWSYTTDRTEPSTSNNKYGRSTITPLQTAVSPRQLNLCEHKTTKYAAGCLFLRCPLKCRPRSSGHRFRPPPRRWGCLLRHHLRVRLAFPVPLRFRPESRALA